VPLNHVEFPSLSLSLSLLVVQPPVKMRTLFFLAALLAVAQAQSLKDIPACTVPCFEDSIKKATSCQTTDLSCVCKPENLSNFRSEAASCTIRHCGAEMGKFSPNAYITPLTIDICRQSSRCHDETLQERGRLGHDGQNQVTGPGTKQRTWSEGPINRGKGLMSDQGRHIAKNTVICCVPAAYSVILWPCNSIYKAYSTQPHVVDKIKQARRTREIEIQCMGP
jgi:hypothetical protein